MTTITDYCRPGCCKNQFGVCAKSRTCPCHTGVEARQRAIDDWEETLKKADERT